MSERVIYHGGCVTCDSQEIFGKRRCVGCQYHKANWALPNLSTDQDDHDDSESVIIDNNTKVLHINRFNDNQKKFLLTFFENREYAGWLNIASKLIEYGRCVVAGTECIWKGGIGNFINVSDADNAVGCSLYEFNIDEFMSSDWYKENLREHLLTCLEKRDEVNKLYNDILTLSCK